MLLTVRVPFDTLKLPLQLSLSPMTTFADVSLSERFEPLSIVTTAESVISPPDNSSVEFPVIFKTAPESSVVIADVFVELIC